MSHPEAGPPSPSSSLISEYQNEDTHFATLFARNAAAIHLLEAVQDHAVPDTYLSECLIIGVDDEIGYDIKLEVSTAERRDKRDSQTLGIWRIGSGVSWKSGLSRNRGTGVELLLCPPSGSGAGFKCARRSIGALHAQLFFHPDSGVLVLRSVCDRPIFVVAGDITIDRRSEDGTSCVLPRMTNLLRFGDYDFSLDFEDMYLSLEQADSMKATRDDILLKQGAYPSSHLDMFPSPGGRICGYVWVHRLLDRDACSSVHSGVRLPDGRPVALKRLAYTAETRSSVMHELEIVAMFGETCRGVLGKIDKSWCEHGISPPCRLGKPCEGGPDDEELIYYIRALAEFDFASLPWPDLEPEARMDLCYQTLAGLGEIHRRAMIHGRIQPRSLVLLPTLESERPVLAGGAGPPRHPWQLPMRAAISSLSSVRAGPHRWGEPPAAAGPWVAPEVWGSNEEEPFTDKADVWALAASWMHALFRADSDCDALLPAKVDDKSGHELLLRLVKQMRSEGSITRPFCDLVLSMLSWDATARPSVSEALCHAAWESLLNRRQLDREDRMRVPQGMAKKVRLLSPEP